MNQKIQSNRRLKNKREFDEVFKAGRLVKGKFVNVWVCSEAEGAGFVIGIIVTRKAAKRATDRNLWKRRIKEIFRRNQDQLEGGRAGVIVVKRQAGVPSYAELEKEFIALLGNNQGEKK